LFTTGRLSQRNDTNAICATFRKNDDSGSRLSRTNPEPAVLSIVPAQVGANDKCSAEHFFRIKEIETVFSDVCVVFGFVPFEMKRGLIVDFLGHRKAHLK
jgi:hypothetical protein